MESNAAASCAVIAYKIACMGATINKYNGFPTPRKTNSAIMISNTNALYGIPNIVAGRVKPTNKMSASTS